MTKKDLIEKIAKEVKITKVQAEAAVGAFTKAVETCLKKNDTLTLVGFGTFSVTKRGARKGRNPATGKTINIPAKKVVKFKAGKQLKDKVN
jgi:DNA-binding protein HU-beta